MLSIKPLILTGNNVQFEPINDLHKNALYRDAQDEKLRCPKNAKINK
jgi:hypothetical protein